MLNEIDLMLRGAVVGITLLAFLILCADPATRAKCWPVGAVAVTLTGMMAVTQGMTDVWSSTARALAEGASHFMPLALTWFLVEIFLDEEKRCPHVNALYGLAGVIVALCLIPGMPGLLITALDVVLFTGLAVQILRSARGDLLERRRSFRTVFVSLISAFVVFKVVLSALLSPEQTPEWVGTVYALIMCGFAVGFAHWALRPGSDFRSVAPARTAPRKAGTSDGADTQVLMRIREAMQAEIWRKESLTIGGMAAELGIPEHRLRKAINGDLGYRNFSSFVNGYRIDAAKAALSNPVNAGSTILEIAYDVGFASLGPFNRAFRAETGQSPSDFRKTPVENAPPLAAQ